MRLACKAVASISLEQNPQRSLQIVSRSQRSSKHGTLINTPKDQQHGEPTSVLLAEWTSVPEEFGRKHGGKVDESSLRTTLATWSVCNKDSKQHNGQNYVDKPDHSDQETVSLCCQRRSEQLDPVVSGARRGVGTSLLMMGRPGSSDLMPWERETTFWFDCNVSSCCEELWCAAGHFYWWYDFVECGFRVEQGTDKFTSKNAQSPGPAGAEGRWWSWHLRRFGGRKVSGWYLLHKYAADYANTCALGRCTETDGR